MIDAARALLANAAVMEDSASDLAGLVVNEIERLEALRAALEAFIDQPGSDRAAAEDTTRTSAAPATGQGPTPPSPSPAITQPGAVPAGESRRSPKGTLATSSGPGSPPPAPTLVRCPEPACGEQVKAQGLGSHMRKHKPGYQPAQRASRAMETAADGKVQCELCDARMLPAGIGPHRRAKHGIHGGRHEPKTAWQPKPEGAEVSEPGSSTWLCGRCPGRFTTAELRKAHYDATGHGSPEPLPLGRTGGLGQ